MHEPCPKTQDEGNWVLTTDEFAVHGMDTRRASHTCHMWALDSRLCSSPLRALRRWPAPYNAKEDEPKSQSCLLLDMAWHEY